MPCRLVAHLACLLAVSHARPCDLPPRLGVRSPALPSDLLQVPQTGPTTNSPYGLWSSGSSTLPLSIIMQAAAPALGCSWVPPCKHPWGMHARALNPFSPPRPTPACPHLQIPQVTFELAVCCVALITTGPAWVQPNLSLAEAHSPVAGGTNRHTKGFPGQQLTRDIRENHLFRLI